MFPRRLFLLALVKQYVYPFIIQKSLYTPKTFNIGFIPGCFSWNVGMYRAFSNSLDGSCTSVMDEQKTQRLQIFSSLNYHPLLRDVDLTSFGVDDKISDNLLEINDIEHNFNEKVDAVSEFRDQGIIMKDDVNMEFSSSDTRINLKNDMLMTVNNNLSKEGLRNLKEDDKENSIGGIKKHTIENKIEITKINEKKKKHNIYLIRL